MVRGEFTIVLVDSEGKPVGGATVYAHWSELVNGKVCGLTDSNGRVVFRSKYVKNASLHVDGR